MLLGQACVFFPCVCVCVIVFFSFVPIEERMCLIAKLQMYMHEQNFGTSFSLNRTVAKVHVIQLICRFNWLKDLYLNLTSTVFVQ